MVHVPDDKRYFRIGEASKIIGVESYVLRYWESEFPQLRPQRADSKQRTYQRKDLETLIEIKKLLYEDKMTIEGAKKRLGLRRRGDIKIDHLFLEGIKEELNSLLEILE